MPAAPERRRMEVKAKAACGRPWELGRGGFAISPLDIDFNGRPLGIPED